MVVETEAIFCDVKSSMSSCPSMHWVLLLQFPSPTIYESLFTWQQPVDLWLLTPVAKIYLNDSILNESAERYDDGDGRSLWNCTFSALIEFYLAVVNIDECSNCETDHCSWHAQTHYNRLTQVIGYKSKWDTTLVTIMEIL